MSANTQPINPKTQRRASQLPCDGVPRYKVGKNKDLTYSQAYAEILKEITVSTDKDGGRVVKHGGALRLVNLNKTYFSVAGPAITKMIDDQKAANAAAVKKPFAGPVNDDEAAEPADVTSHDSPAPETLGADGVVTLNIDELKPGAKVYIYGVGQFASVSRSPNGANYSVKFNKSGLEPIRTRSIEKVKALLTEHEANWEARTN
jgi:hypothetical protein